MRKPSAVLTLISTLLLAPLAHAEDHLVSGGRVNRTLAEVATERTANLASVEGVLRSARAEKVAAVTGIDLGRVRTSLPQLSDTELRDLSHRAAALDSDPTAGHYHEAEDALFVVFVVTAAALVLVTVAAR